MYTAPLHCFVNTAELRLTLPNPSGLSSGVVSQRPPCPTPSVWSPNCGLHCMARVGSPATRPPQDPPPTRGSAVEGGLAFSLREGKGLREALQGGGLWWELPGTLLCGNGPWAPGRRGGGDALSPGKARWGRCGDLKLPAAAGTAGTPTFQLRVGKRIYQG